MPSMLEIRDMWAASAGAAACVAVLPTRDQLLLALCGNYLDGPLCRQAHELVGLHRLRRQNPSCAADFDCRRSEIVASIDRWVIGTADRPRPSASESSRSIGSLIDRMAAAAERAMRELLVSGPSSGRMHEAWTRLGELELAYSDLAAEVADGRRRLPGQPIEKSD